MIMKKLIKGLLILFFLIPANNYAQFWPLTPMTRFGNTVYYELENNNRIELKGTNRIFDKNLENRYFDILSTQSNIKIKINDSIFTFNQKTRKEPNDKKEILFYARRILKNDNAKIRYLKLIELNENSIIAEAIIKYKNEKHKRKKEIVEIDRNQIDGIFLGAGKNNRLITSILSIGGGIMIVLLN
jgi:hypothetical protein